MLFPVGDDNIQRGHPPVFSYLFLAANVVVFVFQSSLPDGTQASFVQTYGAIPAEISQGTDLSTLFSSMFLHGSLLHLLGNMLYLWIFADNIEAVVGHVRFVLFYLAGGLVAGLAQVLVDPGSGVPCVGASGAIAGVMGAYILMFPKSRVRMLFLLFFSVFYIPAWVFLGFWFAQQLTAVLGSGADAGGIAWWAHIGGFVFGLVAGWYFRDRFVTERHILREEEDHL
ncbi:MAG: rhomboid family intramembrane serine protease [Saprospiraceae bacterium]|nr:rhomboid family intramembrane serine protease [Saprospiraceae bacterium]